MNQRITSTNYSYDDNNKSPEKKDDDNIRIKLYNQNKKSSSIKMRIKHFLENNLKTYYDYSNNYYEDLFLKTQGSEYSNDTSNEVNQIKERNKIDIISTKAVIGYTKEMKKKNEEKYPEQFHFYKINNIQEKKKLKKISHKSKK